MSSIEILLIGIGLSMDAFAVSVCKGLSVKKLSIKNIFEYPHSTGNCQNKK